MRRRPILVVGCAAAFAVALAASTVPAAVTVEQVGRFTYLEIDSAPASAGSQTSLQIMCPPRDARHRRWQLHDR